MLSYPGVEWLDLQWHVLLVSNVFLNQMTHLIRFTIKIEVLPVVVYTAQYL